MSQIVIDKSLKYIPGTQRIISENETLEKIQPFLKNIGVTRIANITYLDRIGIPVYSSIRPSAADGAISVYSGKGVNQMQARISAMMEGFERCLAERKGVNKDIDEAILAEEFIESIEKIDSNYNFIEPASLLIPEINSLSTFIEWTEGWDLLNSKKIIVPTNAVYHPYDAPGLSTKLFRTNTNGLAAGNSIEEAILHGILEVLERDALSTAEFNRSPGKEIILTDQDEELYTLLNMCKSKNVELKLWLLPHDTSVPTVVAVMDDIELKDPALLVMGAGSHLDPSIAIKRAITEAAQSRVVQIHGAREDTDREKFVRNFGYERMKRMNKYWYENGPHITLADIPNLATDSPSGNIDILIQILSKITSHIIAIDLSRKSINVPVVRIIIPGFELYTIDRERVGKRIKNSPKKKIPVEERPWKKYRTQ